MAMHVRASIRPGATFGLRLAWWLAASCIVASAPVRPQNNPEPYAGIDSYEEYGKRIQAVREVAPVTDSVFGDQVSLYNGATNFHITDVSIPGNNELQVAVSRELSIQDKRGPDRNGDGLHGFGDWDLDVPYLEGTFTQQNGWTLYSANPGSANRCSDNASWPYTLVPIPGGTGFAPYGQVWNGNHLHIPGAGDQILLANNQPKSYAYTNAAYTGSGVWKWVTASNWKLRCIGSVSNMAGEGFVAVSPSGVSYTFDYAVVRQAAPLAFVYNVKVDPISVARVRIFLLVTRVEDRFGNWVNYSYSSDRLSSITSSDGRSITLTWSGDKIASVTSALGTWSYAYATASWTNQFGTVITWPYLSGVTRPDGSTWSYAINSGALITNKEEWPNHEPINTPKIQCQGLPNPNSGAFRYTVAAPSGASAAYSFEYGRQFRSMVPLACVNDPNPNHRYPQDATHFFDNFYLARKDVSGPGLATAQWNYDYGTIAGSYFDATVPYPGIATEPYEPPGSCPSCAVSKVVTVTGPASATKSTYGVQYARNEGQLLQTQVLDPSSGSVLKTTEYTYVTDAQAPDQPFPDIAGYDLRPNYQDPMGNRNRPVAKTVITQDGVAFTTTALGFDVLARETGATETSSLGSRTTTTTYADNPGLWTLGQPSSDAINGITAAYTDYDTLARPVSTQQFGKLMVTRTWNADGTLASMKDGNQHATVFSGWKRGLPQNVTFADGSSQTAVVNDAGWITAVTDENGFATTYGYDPMGRLASVTYVTGDTIAWNQTLLSFAQVASSEYGIPAGHWKQTVRTGNGYTVTYFDAFWRPLVIEKFDSANKPATLSQTVSGYDAAGRKVFASYPTNAATSYTQSLPGTSTTYDALNRVAEVVQSSELGGLPTTTQYLSGFKTKVVDPRGYSIITSYQAFGEPDTSQPVSMAMPEGVATDIQRDVFGKPLWVKRSGSYGGDSVSATRTFVYDANQLPCKRIEPETGATLLAYDGANNLAWSAPGTALTGTTCDRGNVVPGQKITRSYDARDRLLSIAYPDAGSNTQYTYAADGVMLSAINSNNGSPVTTQYAYNKRRLLTAETLSAPGGKTFAVGYGYDANGSIASLSYPDGRIVTFIPNALGQATQAGSYATGVSYFPNGAIKQFNYGDGSVHTLTQNTRGLPERSRDASGGVAVLDNASDYDASGNVAALTDGLPSHDGLPANVGNIDMSYDGLNRLTAAASATFAGNGHANFEYDPLDNLRSAGVGNGNQYAYAYNGSTNRLASMTGSRSFNFAYDTRGNLVQSNAQAYTFDMADRLRSANGLESYLYDAAGRRARKVSAIAGDTTHYVYDKTGEMLHEAMYSGAVTIDYVYLAGSLVARITKGDAPPPPPPAAPAWINVPASSNDGNVTVSWAAVAGATTYVLQQQFGGAGWTQIYSGGTTSKALSGLANGSYVYRVQACNADGCGAYATSGTLTVSAPQPPPMPASINVPASSSTGSVTISWSPADGAASYVLQQQANGGGWTQAYSGSATSTNLAALANGSYVYSVQACNAVGCSDWRVSGALTVALIPAPPASINVPSSSYGPVIPVNWSASANATNYVLEESFNDGGWGVAWTGNTTSTTVTVPDGGNYRFQVAACAAGGCSAFTASGNIAVTLPPGSAPSLSGPASSTTGTFTLSWAPVAGATRYQLNQNLGGVVTVPFNANGTSWSSNNLADGTYAYQVFACNAAGCGPGSNIPTVVVLRVPGAPATVTAPTVATVNVMFGVQWSAVAGANRYELQQTETGSRNNVSTPYSGPNTSAGITLTGIVDDDFQYAARACNDAGCSAWTNARNSTYLQRKGTPQAVPATAGSGGP